MTDATRRTVRTVVQTVLALAAGLPLIIDAAGIPQTAAGVGVALAVAAGITRVMALPVVENLLPAWLRAAPHRDAELLALDRGPDGRP
ncbi:MULTISPECIES: hypothetical protein [unclassified Streptomyces]|uniref:hypothetical protein n=1 Tax=unclassified Streptomyces TaxID=2593676 RepID=UPI0006AE7CC5|nr:MULTISPECIES: hypothetical protein [unclassified Streptomyces]KOX16579.1 hypothetical protein ADL06_33325 [Streptomyces sp. NRRL F-6491]KOX36094.1 hypothetical protein ADL08_33415 [Streptomyces sp. NRRL F-6492]